MNRKSASTWIRSFYLSNIKVREIYVDYRDIYVLYSMQGRIQDLVKAGGIKNGSEGQTFFLVSPPPLDC